MNARTTSFLTFLVIWTIALLVPIPDWMLPTSEEPAFEWLSYLPLDKIVHLTGYGVLGGLAVLAFTESPTRWIVLALCVAHGALTESVQHMTGYRTGSVWDWIADATGVGLITVLVLLMGRRSECQAVLSSSALPMSESNSKADERS